jgi:hypothetical protein
MNIVVADDLPKSALELLIAEGWTVDSRSGRTPEQLSADLKDADALVVRSATKVTAEIIAAAPKLRAIARAGTGVDNVNVEAASARGIVVSNAPGANSISVAELAMAQLLSLARKLRRPTSGKQGKWDKRVFPARFEARCSASPASAGSAGGRPRTRLRDDVIAHDRYLANIAAGRCGTAVVRRLVPRRIICRYMPSTAQTKRLQRQPVFALQGPETDQHRCGKLIAKTASSKPSPTARRRCPGRLHQGALPDRRSAAARVVASRTSPRQPARPG